MILPDPIIRNVPLHVWLGMVTFLVMLFQILVGTKIIKVPFWIHTKVVWKILLALALIHGFYGFEIYFLNK